MLRLSKKTDYALLALQYLASEAASGVASTRAIAERFDIPGELLAKILQQLARHGLVVAHKGVHGGYVLARPAQDISVAEVVEAIDGPITLTACFPHDERCEQFGTCTIRDPLWRVREQILRVLQKLTVGDMSDAKHHAKLTAVRRNRADAALQVQTR